MLIEFTSNKMQKICSNEKDMVKAIGCEQANKLKQRMMELLAANCLEELTKHPPARFHQMTGNNRLGQFTVDLVYPYRLVFVPNNDPIPLLTDGGYDLKKIDSIKILEIADTH
jgi:proteic killer suppression protein